MQNTRKGRVWFWLLLLVIVGGLSFYLFSKIGHEQKEHLPLKDISPFETARPQLEKQQGSVKEKEEILSSPSESEPPPEKLPEQDPCLQIENQLTEFFSYLDEKKYLQNLDANINTSARFKKILKQLEAMPPVPSSEPTEIIIRNINHFFRVLDKNEFIMIKDIITNEHDTFEIDLEMFYKWLTLKEQCPTSISERPSTEIVYQYAGFFLNTIGGRSYLLRRTPSVRLLITYYCILIIHEMDKAGKNTLGIDIVPSITLLKQEIGHYSEFKFLQEYLNQLNLIETFYIQKRSKDL